MNVIATAEQRNDQHKRQEATQALADAMGIERQFLGTRINQLMTEGKRREINNAVAAVPKNLQCLANEYIWFAIGGD